jgi:hypothetical protein
MKKGILLSIVIFLALVSLSYAQQAQAPQKGELHGYIDMTYTTKYIWRGFDIFGDKSAIHPSVDLDLFGTGFGLNVIDHRANSSGYEDNERWDYSVYYIGSLFQDKPYATNYRLDYVYYNYPDSSAHTTRSTDLQEINAILSWPNIFPVKGLVPSYAILKLWPSNSGTVVGARSPSGGTASGWAHVFMLDYGLPIICPITNVERTLNLHSELVYNDGVGPNGANVDHDWSDAVFGISTNIDLADNIVFTPGVFYQITMDSSVDNNKNETWVSLGMKYKF